MMHVFGKCNILRFGLELIEVKGRNVQTVTFMYQHCVLPFDVREERVLLVVRVEEINWRLVFLGRFHGLALVRVERINYGSIFATIGLLSVHVRDQFYIYEAV